MSSISRYLNWRRSRRSLAVVGITGALLAPIAGWLSSQPAQAASNFGGLQYAPSLSTYGGELNIKVPALSAETVASGEFVLHRIVTQINKSGANNALIQAGIYRSSSTENLDTCATSVNAYTDYEEYRSTTATNFTCHLDGTVASGAQVDSFVANDASSGDDWEAATTNSTDGGGGYEDPGDLGFTTGFTDISTELQSGTSSSTVAADGTTAFTVYGTGTASIEPGPGWYVFTAPYDTGSTYLGDPVHVNSASQVVQQPHVNNGVTGPTGTWSVPNPPTPVTITHKP